MFTSCPTSHNNMNLSCHVENHRHNSEPPTSFGFTPVSHFTNTFSTVVQIWWKFHFAFIHFVIKWLQQHFAHDMTAVLSWHVQNFVVIIEPQLKFQQNKFTIELKLWMKNHYWNRPQSLKNHLNILHVTCRVAVIFNLCRQLTAIMLWMHQPNKKSQRK